MTGPFRTPAPHPQEAGLTLTDSERSSRANRRAWVGLQSWLHEAQRACVRILCEDGRAAAYPYWNAVIQDRYADTRLFEPFIDRSLTAMRIDLDQCRARCSPYLLRGATHTLAIPASHYRRSSEPKHPLPWHRFLAGPDRLSPIASPCAHKEVASGHSPPFSTVALRSSQILHSVPM